MYVIKLLSPFEIIIITTAIKFHRLHVRILICVRIFQIVNSKQIWNSYCAYMYFVRDIGLNSPTPFETIFIQMHI